MLIISGMQIESAEEIVFRVWLCFEEQLDMKGQKTSWIGWRFENHPDNNCLLWKCTLLYAFWGHAIILCKPVFHESRSIPCTLFTYQATHNWSGMYVFWLVYIFISYYNCMIETITSLGLIGWISRRLVGGVQDQVKLWVQQIVGIWWCCSMQLSMSLQVWQCLHCVHAELQALQ